MKKSPILLFVLITIFSVVRLQALNTGVDTLSTINSFTDQGEFYSMDYSGDYSEILDWLDDQIATDGFDNFDPFQCSLFSTNEDDDNQIFGRNFDNPDNDVLICRYTPPDAHASLAFTRMTDLGFAVGTNYDELSFDEMIPLLYSAYFVPDGINEHGLSAGLASVQSITYTLDPTKDTIFITRLIREILDHAQNIQEALDIANNYNVFDMGINTLSHHVLIGTPDNESLVLEYANGAFQAVYPDTSWQVVTNIPVYNIPLATLRNSCWRFNTLYTILEDNSGILSWEEGLDALEQVHLNCPWSAIYDMMDPGIHFIVHNSFDEINYVNLDDFEFILPVGISDFEQVDNSHKLYSFPNPFSTSTTINFFVEEENTVNLAIYDMHGNKIKILVDDRLQSGKQNIKWDKANEQGTIVSSGIYYCQLKVGQESRTIKLVVAQ